MKFKLYTGVVIASIVVTLLIPNNVTALVTVFVLVAATLVMLGFFVRDQLE